MKCPNCFLDDSKSTHFCCHCGAALVPMKEIWSAPTKSGSIPLERIKRGGIFAERYQVIEELGRGGMGNVYRVLDTKMDEEVTLKILKPEISTDLETIERFKTELKLARKISHKNICRVYDLGEHDGYFFITMEYIPGQDLRGLIRQTGQLSLRTAVSVAKQVSEGLAEAHREGVIHRDLKPGNIMIDREGNVRIMDFGIARSIRSDGLTDTGILIGTPEYMSPEQVENKDIDPRSDIYALGVILYEMVSGRLPFEGETPLGIAVKHTTEKPRNPREINSQIPVDLDRLIMKCLEKDKAKRCQTARDLFSVLDRIEKDVPTTLRLVSKKKTLLSLTSRIKAKKVWALLLAICTILILSGLSFFVIQKRPPANPNGGMKMLAVLPFENLGPPEDEYFADGLSEEIMSRLSALTDLGVISRTSAFQYKNTNMTIRSIGEELDVDYILEGTVRWNRNPDGAGRVRVTAQLVRVPDDTHLWSERYDRLIQDIFFLQSEIAEQVVKKLDITILGPERAAISARPTDNLEAFDCYLKAKELSTRAYIDRNLQGYESVIGLFNRAVSLDPGFTAAYLNLFNYHLQVYMLGLDRTEGRITKVREALENAQRLEPESAEVQLVAGIYAARVFQDFDRALEIFESVQRIRPNLSPSYLADIQRSQGNWEEAIVNYEKAFRFSPLSAGLAHTLGRCYAWINAYPESEEWFDRALSIYPDLYYSKLGKARLPLLADGDTRKARVLMESLPPHVLTEYNLYELGMFEKNFQGVLDRLASSENAVFSEAQFYIPKNLARAAVYHVTHQEELRRSFAELAARELEEASEKNPEDIRFLASLGLAYAYLEKSEEAVRAGSRAVALYPVSLDAFEGPRYVLNLAKIYAVIGDVENAIDQLEYLFSIPCGNNYSIAVLRVDPIWFSLQNHPRFQIFLTGSVR